MHEIRYASFGLRFLAFWVDYLIIFLITFPLQYLFGIDPLAIFRAKSLEELNKASEASQNLTYTLIGLTLSLLYYLILVVNYDGATLGKRLLGIKIVKDDQSKVTYATAIMRLIGTILSGLSLFIFGLGYLWILWDKKKQAWHDKIAKTIVIKTDNKPQLALGIFLTIVTIILMMVYLGGAFYKGIQIGLEQYIRNSSTEKSIEGMKPEAKTYYDRSQELFQQIQSENNLEMVKKLNDENIMVLKKALEIEPNDPKIWNSLASAYTWISSEGSLEKGLEAAKKAQELAPDNIIYINGVGDTLNRLGRYEEAVLEFQKALRIDEDSGFTNLDIAIAYKNLKIYDSAATHFKKAIEIFQNNNSDGAFDDEILNAQKEMAELPQK